MERNPVVSIICYAFNHEKFIKETLDGFVMQKTKYPFEIIIHDDASTDRTAEIIREYEKEFPDVFKPIYQTINQHSLEKGRVSRICYDAAKGKYIAMCEGDDYWTDPLKLQKQVDFLEQHPEYGLTHGDSDFFFQEKRKFELKVNRNLSNAQPIKDKEEMFYRLIDGNYKIRTATVLFKKELLDNRIPNTRTFLMGDTPMWLDFSQMTKFKYFDEVFAVYRLIPESATRSADKVKMFRFKMSMVEMRIYYSNKYNYPINKNLEKRYNTALLNLKTFDPDFREQYPLLNPSSYEKTKLSLLSISALRYFYKMELFFIKYKNTILSKMFRK